MTRTVYEINFDDDVEMTLEDCPVGMFLSGPELCLKTEYRTSQGAIEAYIVSSGEFFWGGTNKADEQRKVIVRPEV